MPQTKQYVNLKRKLKRHIDAIGTRDQQVAEAVEQLGYPEPRIRPAGFETMLATIVSQQISTEAAGAIWGRVVVTLEHIEPESLLKCSPQQLRAAGLSGRKVEYALGLAEAIVDGDFDPDVLPELDDETAITQIQSLRGFGRWSAEIYLMFSLQRRDVFPADDLALQVALQRLKSLPSKPTPTQARELIAHWQPYRSAGSLFLWHHYRGAPN